MMGDLKNLVPLLPLILPVLGKLLLMIPFVPNKAIPAINLAVATAAKFWFLAGFGTLGQVPATDVGDHGTTILMAGFFGELGRAGLSFAWGCVDTAAAHFFYEGQRDRAKLLGKTSWLEQGKASIFGKKG
jgi:hypothetical protein